MIALTILPLTVEIYILKNVLKTRNTVSNAKSSTSTLFQLGITIFNNFLILDINIASTLPLPPFYKIYNIYFYFFIIFLAWFKFKLLCI